MDADGSGDEPDRAQREETPTERLDRNWAVLLQELRVTQTGVQVLVGFLLTVPFQPRFTELNDTMRIVYLATVSCAIASTLLLVAPVGMHRFLFRLRRLDTLVTVTHRMAIAGLLLLGTAMAGVAAVIFDMVISHTAAVIAGACTATAFICLWIVLPLAQRRMTDPMPS